MQPTDSQAEFSVRRGGHGPLRMHPLTTRARSIFQGDPGTRYGPFPTASRDAVHHIDQARYPSRFFHVRKRWSDIGSWQQWLSASPDGGQQAHAQHTKHIEYKWIGWPFSNFPSIGAPVTYQTDPVLSTLSNHLSSTSEQRTQTYKYE